MWNCVCSCGTRKVVAATVLRDGRSKSCGCLKHEVTMTRNTKHGHSPASGFTPTYHSWVGMVQRCTNQRHASWPGYGGRGITVCERWMTFANFLADMGVKPPRTSIDRLDNSKGYSPDNCRWSTTRQQASNKRNNTLLTYKGRTETQAEWCRITGIHQATLSHRLLHGWSVERALDKLPKSL